MKLTIGAAALALFMVASQGAGAETVGLGTVSQGTLSFSTGTVIGKVMNDKMGLEARVQPNTGETVLIPLVSLGEFDFGIANVLEGGDAYGGAYAFKDNPQQDLRIAAVLYPLRVAYFVRADSDIRSIADLKGKRVTSGFSAMGTIDRVAGAVLPNFAGVSEPTLVHADDNLLLTGTHVPNEIVRMVVAGLADHKPDLIAGFPLFRGLDPDKLVKDGMPRGLVPGSI